MAKDVSVMKMPICPLYILQTDKDIMCKSHIAGASHIIIRYQLSENLETQLNIFCGNNYKKCEHYLSYQHFNWKDE